MSQVRRNNMSNTYSLKKDGSKKLSANFKVKEFACKDGSDSIIIDSDLVIVLQKIRDHFGKAVTINSAYRNATYNKKIGGASKSQHVYGKAADIVVSGVSPEKVAQYAEYLMPSKGGIGLYPAFTHVDVRANRSRWKNNGKEVSVSGFPGYTEAKKALETGNDIVQELINKHKIKISEVSKAVNALDKAKNNSEYSSLYWIIYKVVNGNG